MTKEQFLTIDYKNEDQFQAFVYTFINHNYPILRKFIFHVPNGGHRNAREGMKLKSMGVLPGCPDLICIKPLFALELKMPKGVQSPAQKQIQDLWGDIYHIAYSPKEVIDILDLVLSGGYG
jgi:hypothetical protein